MASSQRSHGSANRPPRVGIVAGEASGDLLGSRLIAALRRYVPDAEFFGIGGPMMEAQGFDAWFPQEKLAVRGFVEVIRHFRELFAIRRALVRRMRAARPDVFVGIDSPDFNLGVERRLKAHGIPTAQYVSPSVWAWRSGRIQTIRRSVSHMLVLFPFEEAIYRDAGIPVTYVGHPLADEIPLVYDRADVRAALRLPAGAPVIAMLPGSRQVELREHAPLFVATGRLILAARPDARLLVPLVTRETREIFETALWKADARDLPFNLLFGHAQDALAAADVALVASGTATLEAALLRRPMVVTYKANRVSYGIAKRLVRIPYVALPNILAGEFLVPELLQDDATPENIAQALLNLLGDSAVMEALPGRFAQIHEALRQGTGERAAAALLPFLDRGTMPAAA
ncbi:MAG: lipid-A-disaccharide synthase [Burkholderiales bacterium]|nr:lipid-A-disaccharide synthase [Burkholderiales bacterium]